MMLNNHLIGNKYKASYKHNSLNISKSLQHIKYALFDLNIIVYVYICFVSKKNKGFRSNPFKTIFFYEKLLVSIGKVGGIEANPDVYNLFNNTNTFPCFAVVEIDII